MQEQDEMSAQQQRISKQAAEWFATLLDENASAEAEEQFRTWLAEDPRHARAYAEIERLWVGIGSAPELIARKSHPRRTVLKVMGLAGLLAGGALIVRQLNTPAPDYETATGETRAIVLPDGSNILLSTATAIALDFTPARRRVHLLQGEAYFTVAADPARPFEVMSSELSATALGTAFSVARSNENVTVAVTQHAVEVSALGQSRRVDQGYGLRLQDGQLSSPERIDIESRLSWRSGKLVFISTPFEEVVASLSRWRKGKIVVLDRDLARRAVTVIVDIRNADSILQTLEQGLPIRVANISPWLSVIYGK